MNTFQVTLHTLGNQMDAERVRFRSVLYRDEVDTAAGNFWSHYRMLLTHEDDLKLGELEELENLLNQFKYVANVAQEEEQKAPRAILYFFAATTLKYKIGRRISRQGDKIHGIQEVYVLKGANSDWNLVIHVKVDKNHSADLIVDSILRLYPSKLIFIRKEDVGFTAFGSQS